MKRQRGFTLLEMLVAILVGVIMTAGVTTIWLDALQDAKNEQAVQEARRIALAVDRFEDSKVTPAVISSPQTTRDYLADRALQLPGVRLPDLPAQTPFGGDYFIIKPANQYTAVSFIDPDDYVQDALRVSARVFRDRITRSESADGQILVTVGGRPRLEQIRPRGIMQLFMQKNYYACPHPDGPSTASTRHFCG